MIIRVATFLLVFVLAQVSFAKGTGEQYLAYLISSGYSYDEAFQAFSTRKVEITFRADKLAMIDRWTLDLPTPDYVDNPLPSVEQSQIIIDEALAAKEIQRQASKPLEQRQYENQFFDLIEQLYNATGVTNEVTPKLGFPEIRELIDTVQASDPMAAVNYSLELLSIDAALKRYSVLWWDDAIQHDIVP